MRRAIAEEQELMLEDEGSLLPKNGQQGFLDLSKPQDPIDLEEENEYEPTEPPDENDVESPKAADEMAASTKMNVLPVVMNPVKSEL